MSKTTKTVSVIEQVRQATGNPIALGIGSILGGFAPSASFVLAHVEHAAPDSLKGFIKCLFILGALIFSAKSVYQWTSKAFADGQKAAGFVVVLEGAMLLTDTQALSYAALALLIGINAAAAGCNLALQDAPKPKSKKLGSSVVANDNGIAKRNRKVA
jgi:hypothetical protein